MGFKTAGIVGSGEVSLVGSVKGTVGALGALDSSDIYMLEAIGISAGASEGVGFVEGVMFSTGEARKAGGASVFVALKAAVGAGVAVTLFTKPNGAWGFMIFVVEGEELQLSLGAAYSWVQKIR